MTLILFQGHGGRWFMEKIWSKKSRDTVPLNNFFNRRKFRVLRGLSIDIEEEGEGSDRTGCHFLLLNYAAQVYVDIVKGMKAVGFPSWMSASSVELIRHHKPCLLTDNWLICDIYLQIADTVQRHSVFLPSVRCHSHIDGSDQEQSCRLPDSASRGVFFGWQLER